MIENFNRKVYTGTDIAFRTTANGDCLYNAASLSICGHEELAPFIRILNAIELHVNRNFYANHVAFTTAAQAFASLESAFIAFISNEVLNKDLSSKEEQVSLTAQGALTLGQFSPFFTVLSLANVVQHKVQLVCREIMDNRLLSLYNNTFLPREEVDNTEMMHIFWIYERPVFS